MPNVALTGLSATNAIPGHYVEVKFAQGQSLGDTGIKKVLIMGPKTSTGTATVDTQIVGPLGSSDEAGDYFGLGSVAHRMVKAFLEIAGASQGIYELYALAPTESAGANATGVITFSTTATAAGVATVTIAGKTYPFSYATGDTVTTIAAGLKAVINGDLDAPVTADNSSGVLTATAKNKGLEGNTIRFYASTTPNSGTTVDVTTSTAFTSGTQSASYTTANATILGQKFDYIVPHCKDTTALDAIVSQVRSQALPATGFRQQVIAAQCTDASSAATLGSGRNFERLQVANLESCEFENYVLAAYVAGARVLTEISNPSYNHDSYGLHSEDFFFTTPPSKKGDWFTTTELSTQLANGITPIAIAANGKPYIVRSITTKCLTSSQSDFRARDTVRVTVADRFAADWLVRISTAGYQKITADPVGNGKQPPADFVTPARAKSLAEQLVSDMVDDGHLDPGMKSTMLGQMSASINTLNTSNLNLRIPIYTAVLFHQSQVLVAESSPAV